jgi:hypothetical protein
VNTGNGIGVAGLNTATSDGGWGVYGSSVTTYGVYGVSTDSYGVYGTSTDSDGVHGAVSNSANGVYGSSSSGIGVYGISTNGAGVSGNSTNADGIDGSTADSTKNGVYGYNSQPGNGVAGYAAGADAHGLWGSCNGVGCSGVYTTCSGTGCVAAFINGPSEYVGNMVVTGDVNLAAGYQYQINNTCVAGCPSDQRLKKDIAPMKSALDDLLQLRGVTYEWKEPSAQGKNEEGLRRGFIAQDVEKSFPQWVSDDDKGIKHLTIRQNEIEAMEVESIRTLKMQNDALAERVKELETGRRPMISGFDLNGLGFGVGGSAIAGVSW